VRVLADRTRGSANLARGLGYAGMYGVVFFLTQFLQDIQGHSPLATGLGFLPTPTSVFLASQLTSKVLNDRLPAKTLMIIGSALSAAGLVLATQLHAGSPYLQVLASLVLIGTGMGVSFVSLTTAALAGVAPGEAGAASGLINVSQQLGAAVGLAVLVTVFDRVIRPGLSVGLGGAGGAARAAVVHGMDVTFGAAALLALGALAIVALLVRRPEEPEAATRPAAEPFDLDPEAEPAAA
jgi:MFS family permease